MFKSVGNLIGLYFRLRYIVFFFISDTESVIYEYCLLIADSGVLVFTCVVLRRYLLALGGGKMRMSQRVVAVTSGGPMVYSQLVPKVNSYQVNSYPSYLVPTVNSYPSTYYAWAASLGMTSWKW